MDTIESIQKRINANRRLLRDNPSSQLLALVIEEDTVTLNAMCQKEADDMTRAAVARIKEFATERPAHTEWANGKLKEYDVPEEEWL